jgi:hypothetical protein
MLKLIVDLAHYVDWSGRRETPAGSECLERKSAGKVNKTQCIKIERFLYIDGEKRWHNTCINKFKVVIFERGKKQCKMNQILFSKPFHILYTLTLKF